MFIKTVAPSNLTACLMQRLQAVGCQTCLIYLWSVNSKEIKSNVRYICCLEVSDTRFSHVKGTAIGVEASTGS